MTSRGKLCFCTTVSNNAFCGSLLCVMDGWLKHLYQETTSRADNYFFLEISRPHDYKFIDLCKKCYDTRYDWENLGNSQEGKKVPYGKSLEIVTAHSGTKTEFVTRTHSTLLNRAHKQ